MQAYNHWPRAAIPLMHADNHWPRAAIPLMHTMTSRGLQPGKEGLTMTVYMCNILFRALTFAKPSYKNMFRPSLPLCESGCNTSKSSLAKFTLIQVKECFILLVCGPIIT